MANQVGHAKDIFRAFGQAAGDVLSDFVSFNVLIYFILEFKDGHVLVSSVNKEITIEYIERIEL